MQSVGTFGEIKGELQKRGDELADDAVLEPLIRELWVRAAEDGPITEARFESIEDVAFAFVERLQPASVAVERVLRAGRALVEIGEGTERLDAAGVGRLRHLVDRAAIEIARSIEQGRGNRRGAWLSFLSHELKNPLNTMLNALWLLRERGADAPQAARFIELAERAVKKLEERIQDVRALDQQLAGLPPGWEGRLVPKRK
ncbi:MAG TPA: histidine kinase dimerization/phospho-acceptor domain-containing protein [Polyangia bacterium]|nr:histidine kinase dimerization/phospho-acceptor domain-containing protein [Polyangia bacterium]